MSLKKKFRKATKKLKKGIGSFVNEVADKLVPKELAPFLPALAPLFLGPGSGVFMRYLVPQLLTALSTGKTQGDIDLTSQALTGVASALSDPRRFDVAGDAAKFDTKQLQPGDVGFQDPAQKIYVGPGDPQFEAGTGFYKDDPFNVNRTIDAQGNILELPGDITRSGVANVPDPNFKIIKNTPTSFKDLSFGDKLRTGVNETLDFMQGLNEATKFGEPVLDAAGNPVLVRDAGFLQNLPRRTVQQGILSAGPVLASIEKSEEEAAAEAAAMEAEMQRMSDARQALTDFYRNLSDPFNRFGQLPVFAAEGGIMNAAPGMPQGMQVDGRNGTFIPMGVKEKADDVPAMLSKNEFVMTADAVRGMGGGDVNAGAQRMYDLMNSLEARA